MTSKALNRVRHVQILDVLHNQPSLLVRDLSKRLAVSPSTIRRDLDALEAQGKVRRVHGGVILQEESEISSEPSFKARKMLHAERKDMIGRLAADLVEDNDIIFLDGGTTTEFIVPHLADKQNLTVVTCGFNIAAALKEYETASVIILGGELHPGSQSLTGPMALQSLEMFGVRCRKAFISAVGVSAENGIMNEMLERIPLKRKAMEISQQTFVVVDGSKLGVVSLGQIAPIGAVDAVITDSTAPQPALNAIAACGIDIRVA